MKSQNKNNNEDEVVEFVELVIPTLNKIIKDQFLLIVLELQAIVIK